MNVTLAEPDITDEDLAIVSGQAQLTFPCPSVPPIRC
jgi:hypothetical protein